MKELIYHRHFIPARHRYKTKRAVIDGFYEATFEQHADRVYRLVHALEHQCGVSKGDRFAVLARNSHEYLELFHAAFLGGGIINPLNLRLSPKELNYIIRDSGAEIVFVDKHFAPLLALALSESDSFPIRKSILIGESGDPADFHYEDMLEAATPVLPREPEEEDPVVLMYTGGTTGLPKGVVLTQRAKMLNQYHGRLTRPKMNDSTVTLIQTPMFHVASTGALLSTYTVGGTTVIIPGFEPQLVMNEIERNQVTSTTMVPTMIGMMMAHPDFSPQRLKSLEQMTYGASPMPGALLSKLLAASPELELFQGYGMTESSASLTSLSPEDHRRGGAYLRSVGRPVIGVELSIRDKNGQEVATGEIGEVCARGGNFMTEYWNKREATEEVFRNGWYHTGDAGYLDENGYLFLVDRVKDMIVTGGENVYSTEVENAIASHPAVRQVAVIGIPDDVWGEAVHAIVVPIEGASVSDEDLMDHARASVAGYKVPKSIAFRSEPLPLSGAMKVLKRDLRAPYWQDQERSIS
ncbi:MAG: long-chain-fatty-acid--CoA ligase [Pseudomonadota bacterium]